MTLRPFVIIGAGAVGTYIGGSLALHGYRVVWLVRSQHRERLLHQGLQLYLPGGRYRLPATPLVTSWGELFARFGAVEGVFLAVKGYHLDQVRQQWAPYRDQLPPVLTLLNGIDAAGKLQQELGPERVLVGSLLTAVERKDLGHIQVARLRGLALEDRVPRAWVTALEAAGLRPRTYPSAAAILWSKLLTNLLANSLSALLDWTPAQVYRHPLTCRLEVEQQREVLQVMQALQVPVVDLPRTPVRGLAWVMRHLPPPLACRLIRSLVVRGRGGKMPSFHLDWWQGPKRTEAEWYHGPVVRFGERLGVPTPVHRALLNLWQAVEQGRVSPEAWRHRPEELLQALQAYGLEGLP